MYACMHEAWSFSLEIRNWKRGGDIVYQIARQPMKPVIQIVLLPSFHTALIRGKRRLLILESRP